MQSLINKTVGIFSMLRSALHPLATQIAVAFVYGSVARQAETAKSDIDLMVVGKASIDDVISHVAKVEKSTGRPINPTVYSASEFKAKMADGNHAS
jgi:predicted nucleotidyltransferase